MKKNIAILVGGNSEEKKISIKSGKNFINNLDTEKYSGYLIIIKDKNADFINKKTLEKLDKKDFSINQKGKKIKFNLIVILIHGAPGETGELCSYFESLKIPYSSSNEISSKLTFNKKKCNDYLREQDFTVPNSILNKKTDINIKYPCIVKPINSGSSFGVSKVNSPSKLHKAINLAKQYAQDFMIEEFIDGRELTCAVHNFSKEKLITLPLTEIISNNEIFDYNAKYLGQSNEITPANIEVEIADNVTVEVIRATGIQALVSTQEVKK